MACRGRNLGLRYFVQDIYLRETVTFWGNMFSFVEVGQTRRTAGGRSFAINHQHVRGPSCRHIGDLVGQPAKTVNAFPVRTVLENGLCERHAPAGAVTPAGAPAALHYDMQIIKDRDFPSFFVELCGHCTPESPSAPASSFRPGSPFPLRSVAGCSWFLLYVLVIRIFQSPLLSLLAIPSL